MSKNVAGTTTQFVYDGLNPVQELQSGSASANLLTGLNLDEYFQRTDSAGARALLTDALGSTWGLADSSGTVQSGYSYQPFGSTTPSGATSANPYQYTGRENDSGAGPFDGDLYYNRARYYSPVLQRFMSQDPIGFAGGDTNLYAYVANSPINLSDPLGLQVPPALIDEGSQLAEEYGPEIDADIEGAVQATESEADTLWDKTVDYFSKAKQTQLNQGLGRSAENATCPLKNTTRIPSLNNTASYRVPDVLDKVNKIIGDTKNVQYQAMTPQLQDYIDWANENGYTFQLTVSINTTWRGAVS